MSDQLILTIMGKCVTMGAIVAIIQCVNQCGLRIKEIERLSGDIDLEGFEDNPREVKGEICLNFYLSKEPSIASVDVEQFKSRCREVSTKENIDAFVQYKSNASKLALVVLDMDCILDESSILELLSIEAGTFDEFSRVMELAMEGTVSFDRILASKTELLKELGVSMLEKVWNELEFRPESADLITTLKAKGIKVALVSSSYSLFANGLQKLFGIDYVLANKLRVKDDKLTGSVAHPIVNPEAKAKAIKKFAKQAGVDISQVVALANHPQDSKMLQAAGLGILLADFIHPDYFSIRDFGILGVLHLMGITQSEVINTQAGGAVRETPQEKAFKKFKNIFFS